MQDVVKSGSPQPTRNLRLSANTIILCGVALAAGLTLFVVRNSSSTATGQPGDATTPPSDPVIVSCSAGASLYVAPDGVPGNDGTIERPLDLATALSSKSGAKPCDTIWMRGGTYRGTFKSALTGAEGRPVTVRQYPGERATLDSSSAAEAALQVTGSWARYWGFEITNSDPGRTSQESGSWPGDLRRGPGVASNGSHVAFVNLVVHDLARGFEIDERAIGTEFYGNVIYNNGWEGPKAVAQGSGIETQNQLGPRRLVENIIFNQFSHGIAIFGKHIDNIVLEGNVVFNNGSISRQGVTEGRNILLGGAVLANNPVVKSNTTYSGQVNLGYGAGCRNGKVTDNYFAGPLIWVKCSAVMTGNSVYDPSASGYGPLPTQYPDNTYYPARPSGVVVRLRRNEYEPGRANLVVLNWDNQSEVSVNLAEAGLAEGDHYEIRDAQDYFGKPVLAGVYRGGKVAIPMASRPPAQPVGVVPTAAKHTLPEFGVFVIVKSETRPAS